MKFITISKSFYELVSDDREFLHKETSRPHLLLLSLKYKGEKHDFAIPFRSNISPNTPKQQYFPLPPRKVTKSKHRHGLHYIKMFPITSEFFCKFRTENNQEFCLYKEIIENNKKKIVDDAREYLNLYEQGIVPKYSVDIDKLLKKLKEIK